MQIFRKQTIPWALAAGRAALGPILIAGQENGWNGAALAAIVIAAPVSDIFDGILARRWQCDTAAVRLFDSMADTVFYLCAAAALRLGQPVVLRHCAPLLIPLLALKAMRFGLDFSTFGKPASCHSYLAKAWGLVMAVGVVAVFWLQCSNPVFTAAMVLGILCNVEGLAMSLMLPVWRKDVKTLREAWRLRRQLLGHVVPALGRGLPRGRRRVFALARKKSMTVSAAAVLALSLLPPCAFAVESGQVAYIGGTAGLGQDRIGALILRLRQRWCSSSTRITAARDRLRSTISGSSLSITGTRWRGIWVCCLRCSWASCGNASESISSRSTTRTRRV